MNSLRNNPTVYWVFVNLKKVSEHQARRRLIATLDLLVRHWVQDRSPIIADRHEEFKHHHFIVCFYNASSGKV